MIQSLVHTEHMEEVAAGSHSGACPLCRPHEVTCPNKHIHNYPTKIHISFHLSPT